MKYFLILFSVLAFFACTDSKSDKAADENAVEFVNLSFEEALAKAKEMNKMVLVDFYSDGWGGCRRLDKAVFKNSASAEYINSKFISIRLFTDKGWKELREKFALRGTPSVLLFNSDGSEIERITGFDDDAAKYVETLKDYSQNKNTLSSFLAELKDKPDDVTANFKAANRYLERWERSNAVPYLKKIKKLDPEDKFGHGELADCHIAIDYAYKNKDPKSLEKFIAGSENIDLLNESLNRLVRYYTRESDPTNALKAYELAFKKLPADPNLLNSYAWYIYEEKIKAKFADGISAAEKAVELEPKASGIWDTLAWLYFENGEKEKAIEAMKKAVEHSPDDEGYKKNLEKMLGQEAA